MHGIHLEEGKHYKGRSGAEIRIYAMDGTVPFIIHGAVYAPHMGAWEPHEWDEYGWVLGEYSEHPLDIVSLWVETQLKEIKPNEKTNRTGDREVDGELVEEVPNRYPLHNGTNRRVEDRISRVQKTRRDPGPDLQRPYPSDHKP